jgi:hypothetical protein
MGGVNPPSMAGRITLSQPSLARAGSNVHSPAPAQRPLRSGAGVGAGCTMTVGTRSHPANSVASRSTTMRAASVVGFKANSRSPTHVVASG